MSGPLSQIRERNNWIFKAFNWILGETLTVFCTTVFQTSYFSNTGAWSFFPKLTYPHTHFVRPQKLMSTISMFPKHSDTTALHFWGCGTYLSFPYLLKAEVKPLVSHGQVLFLTWAAFRNTFCWTIFEIKDEVFISFVCSVSNSKTI